MSALATRERSAGTSTNTYGRRGKTCFEGPDRLAIRTPTGHQVLVLYLTPLHEQELTRLGPICREICQLTN
jgi:hypothetical protein